MLIHECKQRILVIQLRSRQLSILRLCTCRRFSSAPAVCARQPAVRFICAQTDSTMLLSSVHSCSAVTGFRHTNSKASHCLHAIRQLARPLTVCRDAPPELQLTHAGVSQLQTPPGSNVSSSSGHPPSTGTSQHCCCSVLCCLVPWVAGACHSLNQSMKSPA